MKTEMEIEQFHVTVERKRIKNIYLRIMPPEGRAVISAPFQVTDEMIRSFVTEKSSWICRKQEEYRQRETAAEAKYMTGEKLCFQGKEYLLEVDTDKKKNRVMLIDEKLVMELKGEHTTAQKERLLNEWYRGKLKEMIPGLIDKWEPIMGVSVKEWGVKNMKSRWGTCNVTEERIWLNLQLVKKPEECLEYVVVHEMTHLLERGHGARFKAYMDRFLPNWREIRKLLK